MTQLLEHRLILAVQDLARSTEFWMSTRGFARDFGDGSDGWSWLSRDGFAVGLGECANAPPVSTPWGMREFALRTPDGHRMTFGAEAPTA